MSGSSWSVDRIPRLDGKTIVVTGANGGLGFETARELARAGAHVVLACRSREKAERAIGAIRGETPAASLDFRPLDLSSLASVRAFAASLRGGGGAAGRIDVIVNNAGVMALPLLHTDDGFEMQLATNHLGHFALTGLLLPALVASAPSRVVTVSSAMHRTGKIAWDDLNGQRSYSRWAAYSQSKLANLLFTFELGRRLRARSLDVRAIGCHPGYAGTNLHVAGASMRNDRLGRFLLEAGTRLFSQRAASGALPLLFAAVDSEAQSGDYIGPSRFGMYGPPMKAAPSARALDAESAARLWAISEEMTGVRFLD
jgi:NAD(P)-dependent dehydrogenase (short-subunit alcohol dehydrogenase family)